MAARKGTPHPTRTRSKTRAPDAAPLIVGVGGSAGSLSPQIGKRLFVATSAVETHRRSIIRKLDLHSVADLTKWAIREGLTELEG